jgi:hypothetical protein
MAKMYSKGRERHHGITKDGAFVTSYGKDDSDINVNESTVESMQFRGGVDYVEHSLGAKAMPYGQAPTKSKKSS